MWGGTALALHLGHRRSENLDFVFRADRLPRHRIEALQRRFLTEGCIWERLDDPAAADEFLRGGMDLHDHQQDFRTAEGVRVSCFTASAEMHPFLDVPERSGPTLLDVPRLFALKALVLLRRNKSRDWLDLWWLMQRGGFTVTDFHQVYVRAGCAGSFDHVWQKLCALPDAIPDEGYEALLNPSPSLRELREAFTAARAQYEVELARVRLI